MIRGTSGLVLATTALGFLITVGANAEPPSADKAFATIGPALVKGNYHQYPPFYGNVIASHAVVARATVFCAFQNTKGQPVTMANDIKGQTWSEPVLASEFGLGKDAHGNPSICIDRRGHIHTTNIGRPMVDAQNRPYVSFRYGVGNWKASSRTIVPWRTMFGSFESGRWRVQRELPEDWPEEARTHAIGSGAAAYGDQSEGLWFIYYRTDRFNPTAATSIYLEHETLGFAVRKGGPVKLP